MKNRLYTYYPEFDEDDCLLWHVHETVTNQIIISFVFEDDAQEWCDRFEYGMGFAGFTPAFILQRVPNQDINQIFQAEFA
jgi:hypothetical protein